MTSIAPVQRAQLPFAVLQTIAADLWKEADLSIVQLRPGDSRRYAPLLATEAYEAWLISWSPSGALELHDHGGSAGALRVVGGSLMETYTDTEDRHPLRSRRVDTGEAIDLPTTRIHEVWNPGPDTAVSIHVYSPPLTAMTFFPPD
jgi:predicted metal-dependent enzyme (double-stranded beta helix superfamily)